MASRQTRPPDHYREKLTPFLRQLRQSSPAIHAIYTLDPATETIAPNLRRDILLEKQNTPIKGVVHKFPGRVLVLLSYTCVANCRYCERQDRVGVGLDAEGRLTPADIERAVQYVESCPEINEVILSGGDPLTHPVGIQTLADQLSRLNQIKILRIHSRVPVQQPTFVDLPLLEKTAALFPTSYFSIHVDHPDELTPETEEILLRIRRLGYVMLAQSVFLAGVNDDISVLRRLFVRLSELGIRPYYIYHCQAIPTTVRFVMPLSREIEIMSELRQTLSGIAFPQHVIDLQHTSGKLIVPTSHWIVDQSQVRDYDDKWLDLEPTIMQPLEP